MKNLIEALKALSEVTHRLDYGLLDVIATMQAQEDLKKMIAPKAIGTLPCKRTNLITLKTKTI